MNTDCIVELINILMM